MNHYAIHRVAPHEAGVVAGQRLRMFQDMGQVPSDLASELQAASERALAPLLATGEYVGWFAETPSGAVIAGAGVHIRRNCRGFPWPGMRWAPRRGPG